MAAGEALCVILVASGNSSGLSWLMRCFLAGGPLTSTSSRGGSWSVCGLRWSNGDLKGFLNIVNGAIYEASAW